MGDDAVSSIFRSGLLDGVVCLVSGGGTGLGRATALELAALGARVTVCGRREDPIAETAQMITERGGAARHVSADIRDVEAVEGLVDGVVEREGRLDVLVNNAGGQFLAPAETISPKGFRTVTELNLQGTWQMTQAAATRAFIPQETGKVISVTLTPHAGMPGMVHSGAARAAVENMTRTLAVEWSRFNIRTVAVAAGQFATETLMSKYPKVVVDNLARTIPLGRLGRPEEMAWLIAYLASPAGDFFSGTVISIDGGRDNWYGEWPPPQLAGESGEPLAEERRTEPDAG